MCKLQPDTILRRVLNCRRFPNRFQVFEQIIDVGFWNFLGPDPSILRDSGHCPVLRFISQLWIGRKIYRKPEKLCHVSHEVSGADDSRGCSILLVRCSLKLVSPFSFFCDSNGVPRLVLFVVAIWILCPLLRWRKLTFSLIVITQTPIEVPQCWNKHHNS